jgi:hypothetical protein|tara:strand:+ start:368 stop:787 length:420 start_codon:yes stop_codon:yes gene_type:complete
MSEWCQNKKCPEKKTQSQIRGSKGAKYYQSNKAKSYYFHMFCGQRCMDKWFNEHWQTCLNAVGEIDKQVLPLDDAWFVDYIWGYNSEPVYKLVNKLKGVKQVITREQAQTPEDIERDWQYKTIDDTQARELAIQLGLAS